MLMSFLQVIGLTNKPRIETYCSTPTRMNPFYIYISSIKMETRLILSLKLRSLLSILWLATVFSADVLDISCTANNRITNSSFELNLRKLLDALPSKTSTSGYYNDSVGSGPNTVYGQALCRGDLDPTDCGLCVRNASREIFEQCQTIEGIIWYQLCQVRYSYSKFFSSMTYAGQYVLKGAEITTASSTSYRTTLRSLMDTLIDKAADNSSRRKFAAGKTKVSVDTMYGSVQCTWDISEGQCRSCLTQAWGDLDKCCSSRKSGGILSMTCSLRFALQPFYNATSIDEIIIPTGGRSKTLKLIAAIGIPALVLVAVTVSCALYQRMRKKGHMDEEKSKSALMAALTTPREVVLTEEGSLVSTEGLPFMDLATIRDATENFSETKLIGKGGFGAVYEGILADGTKVAVKRLARISWQGLEEFKNEIILIANLQHRNLVRLLGCGIEGDEKIIVYEFMPNKSLDMYIFDADKRSELSWETRFSIINGIARGLLYLHDGSRLRIIHRDLKPCNVLLDEEMVAKISDFGIARIFCEDQNAASTKRVVGTYGYMAPEYAMEGLFSVKCDVFSYGVIVLEIISGKRSSRYLYEHSHTLVAYAWKLWNEGKELEFVDSLLAEPYPMEEVLRCIHIALLSVQEDPAERPAMAQVVSLLTGETLTLPQPNKPAVSVRKVVDSNQISAANSSIYEMTVSTVAPR